MTMFPIMHDEHLKEIPWDAIEPHERQAYENHTQTLRQLAARGGLTPCEAVAIIEGRKWERMAFNDSRRKLIDYVRGVTKDEQWKGRHVPALRTVDDQQVVVLQAALDDSRQTAIDNITQAVNLVEAMRDGVQTMSRWNFNKLMVTLDRAREVLR